MKRLFALLLLTLLGTGCSKAFLPAVMIGAAAADIALTAHLEHQHHRHCRHDSSRTYIVVQSDRDTPAPPQTMPKTRPKTEVKKRKPPGEASPLREVYHPKD